MRGSRVHSGRFPASTSPCPSAAHCERTISSGATVDGAWSERRRASRSNGWDPTTSWLIAEVEMDEEPEFGLRGGGGIGRADGGCIRVVLAEPLIEQVGEPSLEDVSEALIAVDGTDYGIHSPRWMSRFTDMNPAGGTLPGRTGSAGGRRSPCARSGRWSGSQHRCPGCREPRLEAGPGGQPDVTGPSPRHLPRRTSSGRCPGLAQHHGATSAGRSRRTDRSVERCPD